MYDQFSYVLLFFVVKKKFILVLQFVKYHISFLKYVWNTYFYYSSCIFTQDFITNALAASGWYVFMPIPFRIYHYFA